jgi:integral membrane protein
MNPPSISRNPVPILRMLALVEGVSFLLLLGVAMPLKYFAGQPWAVKAVGWAHGVLFIGLVIALVYTAVVARWPVGRVALVLVGALRVETEQQISV